jgi:CAAX prenyl protease-like protein
MLNSLDANQRATAGYIAPFLVFVGLMGLERLTSLPAEWLYLVRFLIVAAVILTVSRPYLQLRPSAPAASLVIGIAVFLIWVGPDTLFGYRHFWLFENRLTGSASSSLAPELKNNLWFILLRSTGSFLLVPILEELFWRGWMMRWLIDVNFLKVPLGKYTPAAFWIVALLFASEHGPYWEVGLAAGIVYNWWLIRTRNLADCILAHAVTNAVLAGYVLVTGRWQYWL